MPVVIVRFYGTRLADVSLLDGPPHAGERWRLHPTLDGVDMRGITRASSHLFALAGGGAGAQRLLMPGVLSRPAAPPTLARALDLPQGEAIGRGIAALVAADAVTRDEHGRVVAEPWLDEWLGELERLADARRAAKRPDQAR